MNRRNNLFFKSLFTAFVLYIGVLLNASFAYAEPTDDGDEIETVSETSASYDFKGSGIQRHSATGSTNTWSRSVSTMISLYVKNGTVPQITKYDGTYNGVAYHVLEADTSDGNTIIKVDYAGSTPATLNNIYDTTLTANDEYYWAGAINAGFFGATTSSSSYGYPTGAVRTGGSWQTYSSKFTSYEAWECVPDYGHGFTSVYFNRSGNSAAFLYNGWYNGVFYKYYNDSSPNTWDYSPVWDYSEGVSGAYTLMVDGDTSIHWGKDDYSGTNYWTYIGTAITLFGQKANGNYVLLTTSAGSLTASQAIDLMSKLGCVNGIRFDGGGSSQMAYDKGLYIKSISAPELVEVSNVDALSEIKVTVYDGDGKSHEVAITDLSDEVSTSTVDSEGNFTVTAKTIIGDVTVNAKVSKPTISALFTKGYAVAGDSLDVIKNDISSIKTIVGGKETDISLNDVTIEVTGDASKAGNTLTVTIEYDDVSKEYNILVLDDDVTYYSSDVSIDTPTLKTAVAAKGETPTFEIKVGDETVETKNVELKSIDVSKTGVQKGTATFTYNILNKDNNGLVTGTAVKQAIAQDIVLYVQGVEDIAINIDNTEYTTGDELGEVTAKFIQTNNDENASEDDIKIDLSNVNMDEAGTYTIKATYTPSTTIQVEETKLNYTKGETSALNYDWQLGTSYDIEPNSEPSNIGEATLASLDSKLADGSYSFVKQGSSYILVGGVDNSEYVRYSEDDTTAYVYQFEPYHWTNAEESGNTLISTNTDSDWLTQYVFGAKATKGYKYTGHETESTSGILVQNCWSVTKTAYAVVKETTTSEEKVYSPIEIVAEKQIVVKEAQTTTYTVNFYDFDGNVLESLNVNEGEDAIPTQAPEKEGYSFTGWNTDLANVSNNLDVYPEFNCTEGYDLEDGYCVIHQSKVYIVAFEAPEATDGSTDSISFDENGNGTIPECGFAREGYSFVNWNTSPDGTGVNFNAGDMISPSDCSDTSITLYAIWKENETPVTYTVDFYDFDGQKIDSKIVNEGESVSTDLIPEKEGYEFTGWDKDTSNVTSNLSIFPTFSCSSGYNLIDGACVIHTEAVTYTIHFDSNGGNGTMNDVSFEMGETGTIPENEFENGEYIFFEWNTSADGTGDSYKSGDVLDSVPNESMTLYAIWKTIDLNPSEKETEFIEKVEEHYEWSVPATLDLKNGQENELTISITENLLKANQKLVISTDSNIVILTSENGDTNKAIFNDTKFELTSGMIGKKILKISTEWTPIAGTYKGSSTFTANVLDNE